MSYCNALRGHVPSPCPRLPCSDCVDSLAERAAIIEYSPLPAAKPTREDADAMAREQARASLPGQASLL
jgi:hypothetical protein